MSKWIIFACVVGFQFSLSATTLQHKHSVTHDCITVDSVDLSTTLNHEAVTEAAEGRQLTDIRLMHTGQCDYYYTSTETSAKQTLKDGEVYVEARVLPCNDDVWWSTSLSELLRDQINKGDKFETDKGFHLIATLEPADGDRLCTYVYGLTPKTSQP